MICNRENMVVIIPVYNGKEHLERLLQEVLKITKNVILVDDGSTDQSKAIYTAFPIIYHRFKENRGKGAALKYGFKLALENGFECAVTLDSDFQHLPKDINKFLKRQIATGANLIYGRRDFSPFKMPIHRIMSNFLTSLIVSLKIKKKICDSQCGFRLYDLKFIENIDIRTRRYQTETEILIKFAKAGAKFDFVPIETIYKNEKSYISHFRDIKNFISVILEN